MHSKAWSCRTLDDGIHTVLKDAKMESNDTAEEEAELLRELQVGVSVLCFSGCCVTTSFGSCVCVCVCKNSGVYLYMSIYICIYRYI